jgi:Lipid A 3-O-deacylase (PagL)
MDTFTRLALIVVLFLGSAAVAQESPLPWAQDRPWDFAAFATGATGEETTNSFAQAQIWTAEVFAGKVLTGQIGRGWRASTFEYGLTLIPVFVQTRIQTLYGAGFEPVVLRWNSSHHLRRAVPYIELAGGGVFTRANLPPGDTSYFNFTARGGGGVQLLRGSKRSLDLGCRWFHVSNGNLGDKNPEFNGVQVSVGYHWFK